MKRGGVDKGKGLGKEKADAVMNATNKPSEVHFQSQQSAVRRVTGIPQSTGLCLVALTLLMKQEFFILFWCKFVHITFFLNE